MPVPEISAEDSECKHGICGKHNPMIRFLNKVLKHRRTVGDLLCGSRAMCNTQERNTQRMGVFFSQREEAKD